MMDDFVQCPAVYPLLSCMSHPLVQQAVHLRTLPNADHSDGRFLRI